VNDALITPETHSPRIIHWFGVWTERMLRRDFHAVRIVSGQQLHLAALNDSRRPAIVLMNHPSWWDPLIGIFLSRRFTPSRPLLAPMEAEQLAKFRFFRKLGIFGVDPDQAGALQAMQQHVISRLQGNLRHTFWVTPQGEFTDPRVPMRLRPGAAAIAAALPEVVCICMAAELVFWNDRRPELLLSARTISDDASRFGSTTGWTRVLTEGMTAAGAELAAHATARNAAAFDVLLGAESAKVSVFYDAWAKLTGRNVAIEARRRSASSRTSGEVS